MPDRTILVYSLSDLGITAANYNFGTIATGGTFTASAAAAPTAATVTDTDSQDNIFNDGVPGNFAAAPTQLLNGTIDGTVFTNAPTNPENEFEVFDSSGASVGFIYDLHNANSAAFSSLQGYVTTFELVPGETYSVTRTTGLPTTSYDDFLTCFVQGTRIETVDGPVAIEELREGDLIMTRDDGAQPLRWLGQTKTVGKDRFAPIMIKEGALGNSRDLRVSPLHRMLICGLRAELMFGESEVLVCAKHLVDGDTIFSEPCDEITYFHLMFDQHQIVMAEGCPSESYYPGATTMNSIEEDIREEVLALFPELEHRTGSYGPTVRMCLRRREAALLRSPN
ncbi:hypothetical protein GCM10007385_32110 [Tateyamaria omphalii]|uniref:Hint domain-containing protein n=1 Tax=Tateyamaria omphalii TaxID=299262 RepID=UPI001677AFCE|nr:Hint domain-containing protein [Tateyamaria omphalii]GGX60421.1 hypothetical protein GCM10007385_32110 [Tateyamaria omphalii]